MVMGDPLPHSQIEKGTFLIATPDVQIGMFFRGVILVCEHSPNGSFGLCINKQLEIDLPEEILDLQKLENPKVGVRAGGPVQTNQMMLLHTNSEIPQQTLQVCDGVFLGGDLDFLHGVLQDEVGPDIHLCFGYAGWGAGQLEREFLDGHWFLCPATKQHIFETPADQVWQTLLKQMGGKYAALSMIPEDLSLN
jgi:putative transcriptional regulator